MGGYTQHDETFANGEIIVNEGDDTREMYIIQSGAVAVSRTINGQQVEVARLPRGAFFGEMSLLESVPRNATIRAIGETTLVVIKPGSLLLKIRRNPTFALEMLQELSRRVRSLNGQLEELMTDESLSADLAEKLERLRQASLESFEHDNHS